MSIIVVFCLSLPAHAQFNMGAFWKAKRFTPAAFSFTNQTDVATNTTITSNAVTLTGTGSGPVLATCSNCTLEINNSGTFSASVNGVKSGDGIRIRRTSSASNGTTVTSSVTVGATTSGVWSVTTLAGDTTPDSFTIGNLSIQPLSTIVSASAVTPTGYAVATSIAVSGSGSPEVSINNGAWVTSTTISPGQNFRVRMTTSGSTATPLTATVTIGGVSANWTTTTYSSLGGNLFANGGAESGDMTWSNQGNCSNLRTGSARSGSFAFSVYTTSGTNAMCFGQIPVTFTVGKTYQITFWTRSDNGGTSWGVTDPTFGSNLGQASNSTTWEYKTIVFQATNSTHWFAGHGYLNNRNYLDDVEIRELQ